MRDMLAAANFLVSLYVT